MLSIFDIFQIGVGPSSSHTVGPMRAAQRIAHDLRDQPVHTLTVDLLGSLAATATGHGTINGIVLGLLGFQPEKVTVDEFTDAVQRVTDSGRLTLAEQLGGTRTIGFDDDSWCLRPLTRLPRHPNGMIFRAVDEHGTTLLEKTAFSVGGGAVEWEDEPDDSTTSRAVPHDFTSAASLLASCRDTGLRVSELMRVNEESRVDDPAAVRAGTDELWTVMQQCVDSSLARTGVLPGGLGVKRRAGDWYRQLQQMDPDRTIEHWQEWVSFVAMAVQEENASHGRVVTAPTNGAAGVIPAVLHYALHHRNNISAELDPGDIVERYFLAAGAVGVLYKEHASVSGADVGCQGEIGAAASMAAAGLADVLGGTPAQVENAAEIAMEHNLGLTCDPLGGLVQVPCIERNAIAAQKAIGAARMALMGDGSHRVTLDEVIHTMVITGRDMSEKYKETSTGGLAVSVADC